MGSIEKTGDWDGFAKMLAEAGAKFQANIQAATNKNGRLIEQRIVERIQSNQVSPPTSAEFREWKAEHGYSVTTLVMSGTLMNAIKYDKRSWNEGFVGVFRNAENRDGTKLSSLAAVHEYGRIDGSIPARPFIGPAIARSEREIVENYQKAVEETFRK